MRIDRSYLKPDNEYPRSTMEITDKSLTQASNSLTLSHKFSKRRSTLESRSHRDNCRFNRGLKIAPKSCQINSDRESKTAFSILQYQLNDRQAKAAHLNNLKLNLERRLQSAKARGDRDLVNILNQEFEQLIAL